MDTEAVRSKDSCPLQWCSWGRRAVNQNLSCILSLCSQSKRGDGRHLKSDLGAVGGNLGAWKGNSLLSYLGCFLPSYENLEMRTYAWWRIVFRNCLWNILGIWIFDSFTLAFWSILLLSFLHNGDLMNDIWLSPLFDLVPDVQISSGILVQIILMQNTLNLSDYMRFSLAVLTQAVERVQIRGGWDL